MDKAGLHRTELFEHYEEVLKPKLISIPYKLGEIREIWQREFANKKIDWRDEMYTNFNKDMLKHGMLVETRDGRFSKLGINPKEDYSSILIDRSGCYLELDCFNDNLTYVDNENWFDVVRVYEPNETEYNFSFDIAYHTLIWEGNEKVELTMQEIADKFNVSVDDLRIKGVINA